MKATELRIGNWVHDVVGDFQINGHQIDMLERRVVTYKPIPLTEEWLIKFGFELEGYYKKYPLYSVMQHDESELICIGSINDSGNICCSNVKYVHQLQNLYFSLTGKELELEK